MDQTRAVSGGSSLQPRLSTLESAGDYRLGKLLRYFKRSLIRKRSARDANQSTEITKLLLLRATEGMAFWGHVKEEKLMNDLHPISTVGSAPAVCDDAVSAQALALARVLYPDEPFHKLQALEIALMETVGAVLPKMPDRLPSVQRLQAMDATTRSFRLMILIAALAIQFEMLRTGMHVPADRSRPMKAQLRNARRRLRRACLHAELSHLWRDGRWKIGGLMQLLDKHQNGTYTR